MDRVIVAEKLESLRKCIQRIKDKTPLEIGPLLTEPDLQDIVVLNLTRAVQFCVDIGSHVISTSGETAPVSMGDVFVTLNKLGVITTTTCESMKKAVGFRNIAVHNYEPINWEIVFSICNKSTVDFREFVKEIESRGVVRGRSTRSRNVYIDRMVMP